MKKIIGYGIGGIVVVLLAVFAYIYFEFSGIVKTAVESEGPKLTKSEIRLGGVDVSVFSGEAGLNDLLVGNPKGFKTDSALKLGKVSIALDTGTLTEDVVVIREIQIIAPEITYELGDGGSNITVLQKNVQAATGGSGAKKDTAKSEGGKKFVIDRVVMKDAKLGFSAGLLQGKKLSLPLPDIELRDVGKSDKSYGAHAGEVLEDLLARLNKNIGEAIAKAGLGDLQTMGGEVMKDATRMGEDAMKKATGAGEDMKKEAEGAVEGVGKSIKGLFGK